jgi:hypothetical protein
MASTTTLALTVASCTVVDTVCTFVFVSPFTPPQCLAKIKVSKIAGQADELLGSITESPNGVQGTISNLKAKPTKWDSLATWKGKSSFLLVVKYDSLTKKIGSLDPMRVVYTYSMLPADLPVADDELLDDAPPALAEASEHACADEHHKPKHHAPKHGPDGHPS